MAYIMPFNGLMMVYHMTPLPEAFIISAAARAQGLSAAIPERDGSLPQLPVNE